MSARCDSVFSVMNLKVVYVLCQLSVIVFSVMNLKVVYVLCQLSVIQCLV